MLLRHSPLGMCLVLHLMLLLLQLMLQLRAQLVTIVFTAIAVQVKCTTPAAAVLQVASTDVFDFSCDILLLVGKRHVMV